MHNGPLPSRLILLADLPTLPPAEKVRVLGCVTGYSTKKATMTLEHNYPAGNGIVIQVDVQLLLNTLKSTDTQLGEWVNVVGYTTSSLENNTFKKHSANSTHSMGIQAILLWPAGPLKLDGYEKCMEQLKNEKAFDQPIDRDNLGPSYHRP